MLEVRKNVPIPKVARPETATRRKYPFDTMEVGDMFFVPDRTTNNLSTHASTVGRQLGMKFSTRLTTMRQTRKGWVPCPAEHADCVTGIGVWRVK